MLLKGVNTAHVGRNVGRNKLFFWGYMIISEDLRNLGVVRNKTYVLRYIKNSVPCEFLSSFFRGLFDGDGTIGKNGRGYYFAVLSSRSRLFLDDLKEIFPFVVSVKSRIQSFFVVSSVKENIINFYKWIYEYKGDLYLRRKYEKVQDQIN